ncbi:MAG: hypothetical protein D6815_07135 [Candidatus Dadabacteria bacterium]|nr:MAG: hypothetical protein D6815_07135 [Candidatus Dadabacteria bacterium]
MVGDEGDVAEVGLDGKLIATRVLGGDLEGVTCDPASGLVYVVREGHEILFELDPDTLKPRRRFLIDRSFGGDPNFLRRGGDGIEGLTFVPSKSDPEGGRFYAVNQYDPPVLVELRVPLRSSQDPIAAAEITGAWPLGPAPLSGVTWDPPTGVFLVPSALWHSALVVSRSGTKLGSVRIPGFMQEGITRVPGGSFVIAQDSGGLVKWTPPRDPFAEALRSRGSVGQDRSGNGHEGKPD